MLQVSRKYFGIKPMLYLFTFLFIGIVLTALFLDYLFAALGWIPDNPTEALKLPTSPFELNFGSVMNFVFIPLALSYYWFGKVNSRGMVMDHH